MISIPSGKKRVLIAHYRVGMTDGVSLEIAKRRHILEMDGFIVASIAGPGSSGADFVLPSLDFNSDLARKIADNAFGELKDYSDESGLMTDIERLSKRIDIEIEQVINEFKPDFILLHNIFSHGRHIASASAFRAVLLRHSIPALATHHDFYWERNQYRYPSCPSIRAFLELNIPPVIPGLKHACINSLAASALKQRAGIEAMVFPDTLDFDAAEWSIDPWNARLPEDTGFSEKDIIVLQATRIVRRKGIELIIPVLKYLNTPENLKKLRGRKLYNGKIISEESRFFYLIAGYAEEDAEDYLESLEHLLADEKIPHRFIGNRIAAERSESEGKRTYSLFDVYPHADIISYPSTYEGWGNQFLEALFARKPVMLFEYPVFKSDIRDRGYSVISMGDRAEPNKENNLFKLPDEKIEDIAINVISTLLNIKTPDILNHNFDIGKKHNSYEVLESLMAEGLALS